MLDVLPVRSDHRSRTAAAAGRRCARTRGLFAPEVGGLAGAGTAVARILERIELVGQLDSVGGQRRTVDGQRARAHRGGIVGGVLLGALLSGGGDGGCFVGSNGGRIVCGRRAGLVLVTVN